MIKDVQDLKINLTPDEALILFEWLTRYNESAEKPDPDEAEQRVLWNVECLLQKILVEPFDKNYDALIKQAKARLMQG